MSVSLDQSVVDRLASIETILLGLLREKEHRENYSVEQFAEKVNRDPFTVREWARLGRIHAGKKGSGRGRYQAWVIGHAELLRFEREGLLLFKDRTDSPLLDHRIQVRVPAALLFGRVPDPSVDQPLVGAFHHASRR